MTGAVAGRRALVAGALAAAAAALLAACAAAPSPPTPTRGAAAPVVWPPGLPATGPVACPGPTVTVSTSEQLHGALEGARAGTVISLAAGTYRGGFTATGTGTADAPVFLCGPADAVLRGRDHDRGTVLHLKGAAHWRLVGFSVRSARKGVMVDATTDSVLQGLTVDDIGDEAVHLRRGSRRNLVRDNAISGTGRREEGFGEGVYVGSAHQNWCRLTGCGPDRSDANVVASNRISATTAEAVDVKEGTTGGVVVDNVLDGSGLSAADSWVDVKGDGWLVQGNHGTSSPGSGFQSHAVLPGWGTGNTFDANVADVRGPGWGVELRPARGNRATCTNEVRRAGSGASNAPCR